MGYIEEEREKIIKELLDSKKVRAGQFINYAYFLLLYRPYKEEMGETEFAEILGITYNNYSKIKYLGVNTRILKDRQENRTEKEKNRIIREVIENGKVRAGQLINHDQFLKLYEPYEREISETEFAGILEITYSNFNNIKSEGTKAKILKSREEKSTAQEAKQIIKKILHSKEVRAGQLINYEQFMKLYNPYKDKMRETEFAEILGISYGNYSSIKYTGKRTKVLQDSKKNRTEKEKNRIIREVIENGKVRAGQLINYTQFVELYSSYKEEMEEKEFAEILEINYSNYKNIKNKGHKTKILKSTEYENRETIEILDDKKEKISKEVIRKELFYSEKIEDEQTINYVMFIELYKTYKDNMEEKEFAEVLGISYDKYTSMKNKGTNTTVLIERQRKIENEKEKILSSKKVKAGQYIDYPQFLEIYDLYKEQMSEREFAEVLGINYKGYHTIKHKKGRTQILKDRQKDITEEEKEEIIKELLDGKRIKVGQFISYTQLLELYKPYEEEISEIEFAEVLGINYSNYQNIKNKKHRTQILKDRQENITEEEKEEIIKELLDSKIIKAGQFINYTQFLELYKPYKEEISEIEFAEVLGINYSSYQNIKNGVHTTQILKDGQKRITEEEKEEIIKELLDSKIIKAGQFINYTQFLELYKPYKEEISEIEFANILGISYVNHQHIKNGVHTTQILKDRQKDITEEEKEEIIKELLDSKIIKAGQFIDYTQFLELYKPYKEEISEIEFAEVLGINYSNYQNIKNKEHRTQILKDRQKRITEEEKEEIIKKLLDSKRIKEGQSINYAQFLELYKPYKEKINESQFAKILGISHSNYKNIKNRGATTKVSDYRNKAKMERVKYILSKESRYYTKDEIESVCDKLEIDLEDFIIYICGSEKENHILKYQRLLEEKSKIYIGKSKLTKKFASKYSTKIIEKSNRISRFLCKRYGCIHLQEDIASNALVYILEKCGDIEKNFEDNEQIATDILFARIFMHIKYQCLGNIRKKREFSFYRKFTYKGDRKELNVFDRGIEDKSQNIEGEIEEKLLEEIKEKQKMDPEEECIRILMNNIEAGLTRKEAILRTGEMLGISPEEMLKSLQQYMIKQKRVRGTEGGGFVLGE